MQGTMGGCQVGLEILSAFSSSDVPWCLRGWLALSYCTAIILSHDSCMVCVGNLSYQEHTRVLDARIFGCQIQNSVSCKWQHQTVINILRLQYRLFNFCTSFGACTRDNEM